MLFLVLGLQDSLILVLLYSAVVHQKNKYEVYSNEFRKISFFINSFLISVNLSFYGPSDHHYGFIGIWMALLLGLLAD